MSDEQDKPTLSRKPLGLKRTVEAGQVQQQFSHGRRNTVVVEVKRRRVLGRPGEAAPTPEVEEVEVAPAPAPAPAPAAAPKPAAPRATENDSLMSRQERQAQLLREAEEARMNALEETRRREEAARARAAEEEKTRAAEARVEKAEAKAAEPAPAPAAEAAPEAPAAESAGEAAPAARPASAAPAPRRFTPVEAPKRPEPKPPRTQGEPRRRQSPPVGQAHRHACAQRRRGARARSLAALKRAREKEKRSHTSFSGPREKQVREVVVPESITVQELANRMAEKGSDLVKALFKMGSPVTINQTIDQDTAELLVTEFGHEIKRVSEADIDIRHDEDVDDAAHMKPRAPVVTIMGHVDHGKTSLLDALRGANVQAGEAGGITQHIGAYQVKAKDGSVITFLDTPGHEAFTEMRQRGANITDIVILVVAADDGLKPQSIEAINHAKAAGVPIIVAINKVDKEGANAQRVRERLLEHELVVEEMGGDVQNVEVSALKKTGLDKLLDAIALQAEIMELKANPDRAAEGTVVEAKLDKAAARSRRSSFAAGR